MDTSQLKSVYENGKFRLDLEGLTEDDLQDLKIEIDEEIASIRLQLDEAKARAAQTGEYSDSDWWRRANSALKIKGSQSQQIQAALSKLKRKKSEEKTKSFENCFVDVARRELSSEAFNQLYDLAVVELKLLNRLDKE